MRFNILFQRELKLKWERLADMPETMMCPRSARVDGAVYVTAGNGGHDIHKYDLETQQWSTLPRYQYSDFAMTGVDNSTPSPLPPPVFHHLLYTQTRTENLVNLAM